MELKFGTLVIGIGNTKAIYVNNGNPNVVIPRSQWLKRPVSSLKQIIRVIRGKHAF